MTKVYITESGYKLNVASTLRMTASEAETLLDGVFEPVLGNPGTNGYVLSSTTAGVRSWVAQSGGGGDVDTITTTTGSSTNMLRVAAAGGLEYRTTAQVLSDIGAAPTASPTFTGTVTLPTTVASVIKPASDSTTALQLANAAGTAVVTVDTVTPAVSVAGATTLTLGTGNTFTVTDISTNDAQKSFSVTALPYSTERRRVSMIYMYAINDSTNALYFGGGSNAYDAPTVMYFRVGATSQSQAGTLVQTITSSGVQTNTGTLDLAASTTAAASLRIRSGTAPTSPNAGDIWNDGTDFNLYGSGLKLHTGVIKPASDSTTALQLANAAGSAVVTVDTTNNKVSISGSAPTFEINGVGSTLVSVNRYQNSIYPAEIVWTRGRGTAATPTALADGDGVGTFSFYGYRVGDILTQFASIDVVKTSTSRGVSIAFNVANTAAPTTRLKIWHNDTISIGHGVAATAYADIAASTTAAASLRIRSGTAPTTPNAGDVWFDGTNLMMYDGTTTRTISWT